MRDLRSYRAKRDPERTPEPFGHDDARAPAPGGFHAFVVQQHAARALHYDLRLEIEGVLVSWAIPKGPSLDPSQRRLAVQTEDHPLEYAGFEGVIPAGNYGAGAMIVWDRGVYRTRESAPAAGLEGGKLDLDLYGHKLRGRFALVRTKRGGGREWLFFAKRAAGASEGELVVREPASVLSGLTVQELGDGRRLDAEIEEAAACAGAERRRLEAAQLRPMLAATESAPFRRRGWLFELKHDGVRALAEKRGGEVRIFARSGADRTAQYAELAKALRHLPIDNVVLDGEIVALDGSGRSSFERIQRRFTPSDPESVARARREVPVCFYAFDMLSAGAYDLRPLPLRERKALLARIAPRCGFVRFTDHLEEDGVALFAAAERHGLEGIVGKRMDAPYECGRRSRSWLKLKAPRRARLVIAGVVPGQGSRAALGSLILAGRRGDEWAYAGNVGSGIGREMQKKLERALEPRALPQPGFSGGPRRWPRGARFVRPELVCEVRFTEVTSAGVLRQPVFLGLCEGALPEACAAPVPRDAPRAEASAAPPPATSEGEPRLTRLDKVFWPIEGYTKGDLLAYYERVWPWLAPYLADRPLVLTRYPDGIEGKSFYQKNAPEFTPDWVQRASIDGTDYFICNELRTLLHVVNSGAIPLHVWSARLGSLEHPDWLILDLDPKQAPFTAVIEVARHLHRLFEDAGTPHFAKTSGQSGLHVLLPLGARYTHDEARALAEAVARTVAVERPDLATVVRPLAGRGEKVYVDFLQNGRGKLIAAPLCVRPRPGAPVSMPLAWREVTPRLAPVRYTIRTAVARLARSGDPLRDVLGAGIDAVALLGFLTERLGRARPRAARA